MFTTRMRMGEQAFHAAAKVVAVIAVFALVRVALSTSPAAREADLPAVASQNEATPGAETEFVYRTPAELMREHLKGWKRPDGPIKVAIQAGHWKSADAPDEQDNLRFNGAEAAGKEEWEITLAISERVATLLRAEGLEVEVLPTVVPPRYFADVFVSVHADEADNKAINGYRTAPTWLDFAGTSGTLSDAIDAAYGEATGQQHYPEITDGMRRFYAFNWLNFEHSLHPMTPAAIIETGYMTSAVDRAVIFNRQDAAAKGIANGVLAFLKMR